MHMPTGDCGTGDSNPEALPPPLPKEPLNPYATVAAFPVHPLSWSFIPFCRVLALQKSLKPPVVQPFLAQGEDRERNCTQISLYPGENIFSKSQQVGRTARTMSRKKLLSSGRCIQHPQQRVKEPFISSV